MARPKPTRRRARPAKAKGNVDRLLAESREREAVARAQQSATSEILRVISQSPADAQPVFDTIVRNALVLCHAVASWIWLLEGDWLTIVAPHNVSADFPSRLSVGDAECSAGHSGGHGPQHR
jgi:hypothetical protein